MTRIIDIVIIIIWDSSKNKRPRLDVENRIFIIQLRFFHRIYTHTSIVHNIV